MRRVKKQIGKKREAVKVYLDEPQYKLLTEISKISNKSKSFILNIAFISFLDSEHYPKQIKEKEL
jgi:hypothetical protein